MYNWTYSLFWPTLSMPCVCEMSHTENLSNNRRSGCQQGPSNHIKCCPNLVAQGNWASVTVEPCKNKGNIESKRGKESKKKKIKISVAAEGLLVFQTLERPSCLLIFPSLSWGQDLAMTTLWTKTHVNTQSHKMPHAKWVRCTGIGFMQMCVDGLDYT